jgi:hypothetical protein
MWTEAAEEGMARHVICGRLSYQPKYHSNVRVREEYENGESEKVFMYRAITLPKESFAAVLDVVDHHEYGVRRRELYVHLPRWHSYDVQNLHGCVDVYVNRRCSNGVGSLNFAAMFPERDF